MRAKSLDENSEEEEAVADQDTGELRQDFITGKWVVVATGRAVRPHTFVAERAKPTEMVKFKDDCPFCRLDLFPQETDVVRLPDDDDSWEVHIFPNKYPAFAPLADGGVWQEGPYTVMESVGYHEVLATRWHNQIDSSLTRRQWALHLEALVKRYRQLRENPAVRYIQIIKNHGIKAGGSLEHPHQQIFTVPVLPSDVRDILTGAEMYAKKHGADPFADLLAWEKSKQKRIIYENELFVAFCPFTSRVPFEVWVVPRKHDSHFENIGPNEREGLADAMHDVLKRLYVSLNDPPYNYYIYTAPCDDSGFVCEIDAFQNFRWHIQILPRLNVWGGFEMGTGVEITTALPEESAKYLKEAQAT